MCCRYWSDTSWREPSSIGYCGTYFGGKVFAVPEERIHVIITLSCQLTYFHAIIISHKCVF